MNSFSGTLYVLPALADKSQRTGDEIPHLDDMTSFVERRPFQFPISGILGNSL